MGWTESEARAAVDSGNRGNRVFRLRGDARRSGGVDEESHGSGGLQSDKPNAQT